MARWQYALNVLGKYLQFQDKRCPHCGTDQTNMTGTKHLMLQLRHCEACGLFFRWPKDELSDNVRFYEEGYQEPHGITTRLPDDSALQKMLQTSFANTNKDFSTKIAFLQQKVSQGRVLDFGASWGYGTWQLKKAGYEVVGLEVDRARAQFGREKLAVPIVSDWQDLPDQLFDAVFTSHVLEHLPTLDTIFNQFYASLNPGGYLIIFVPNCTGIDNPDVFAKKKSFAFGEKHTFAFTKEFFARNLPNYQFTPHFIGVSPYEQESDLVNRPELIIIASRNSVE